MAPSCCVPKQACTRLLPKGPSVRPVLISRSWKLRAQSSGRDLPKTWNQVVEWANKEFYREVDTLKPDESISLAKAFMLLALEEEAALEVHPEMIEVLQSLPGLKLQSHASASTWSLERLDALAAEIKDLVMASVKDWEQQSFAASSAKLANASHAGTGAGAAPYEWDARDAAAAAAAAGGAVGGTATSVSAASKVNASASTSSATEEAGAQASSVDTGRTAASLDQYRSGSPTTASSAPSDFLQLPPGLFKAFPGQVVSAINEVLYERHGYAPCNRWGNIRDAQLSRVLEGGMGCSPALSVLYLVVAQKLGIRMAVSLSLESGRYFVLYPLDEDGVSPLLLPVPTSPTTSTSIASASPSSSPSSISTHGSQSGPAGAQVGTSSALESSPLSSQSGPAGAQADTPSTLASNPLSSQSGPAGAQAGTFSALESDPPAAAPAAAESSDHDNSVSGGGNVAESSALEFNPPAAAPVVADGSEHDSSVSGGETVADSSALKSSLPAAAPAAASSSEHDSSVSGGGNAADSSESPSTSMNATGGAGMHAQPSSKPAEGGVPHASSSSDDNRAALDGHAAAPLSTADGPSHAEFDVTGGRGYSCSGEDDNPTVSFLPASSPPCTVGGFPHTGTSTSGGDGASSVSSSSSSSSSSLPQSTLEQRHIVASDKNAQEGDDAERRSEGPSSRQQSTSSSSSSSSSGMLEMGGKQAEMEEGTSARYQTKRCVIDPYGCGGLLELEEVCELFEVKPEVLLQPASQRQVLAALLARQMDAFFAKAVGCSASPASMVPLSIETALDQSGVQLSIGSVGIHALSRALAAAEKRMVLLPGNSEAQLKVALLHYFSRNFDDAYLELGTVLERESSSQVNEEVLEKGNLLLEKVRLELMFKENRL